MRAIIIGGEEFRIQGAMIACNSEGEALSPGALAGDASASNQTAVQANAGSNSSKVVGIQGVTGGKAVPVTAATTDTKLDQLKALIGTAADDPGDNTVIGLLKQIAENTTPA
jgi:hypothetical protein